MEQPKILEILGLSPKTEKAVLAVLSKKQTAKICKNAYSGEAPDYPILKRKPLTRLAILINLLSEKYEEYLSLGVPGKVIAETFRDVTLRAEIFEAKTGKTGISKEDAIWFRHIINCKIFKIGVLQFQPFEMIYLDEEILGEAYMVFSSEQKKKTSRRCSSDKLPRSARRRFEHRGNQQKFFRCSSAFCEDLSKNRVQSLPLLQLAFISGYDKTSSRKFENKSFCRKF